MKTHLTPTLTVHSRLRARMRMRLDGRSRRGLGEAAGSVLALPVMWTCTLLVLVTALWLYALGVNAIGVTRAGEAASSGRDGEAQRRGFLAQVLAGYARPYGTGQYEAVGRGLIVSVNVSGDWESGHPFTVQAGTVTRAERFYAKPEDAQTLESWANGGWE